VQPQINEDPWHFVLDYKHSIKSHSVTRPQTRNGRRELRGVDGAPESQQKGRNEDMMVVTECGNRYSMRLRQRDSDRFGVEWGLAVKSRYRAFTEHNTDSSKEEMGMGMKWVGRDRLHGHNCNATKLEGDPKCITSKYKQDMISHHITSHHIHHIISIISVSIMGCLECTTVCG